MSDPQVQHPIRITNLWSMCSLLALWVCALVLFMPEAFANLFQHLPFSLLGTTGAIFANSTGAGGGVVFIPVFNQLQMSEAQSVATSFGIQSFGMTAGAITWFVHYRLFKTSLHLWQPLYRIIGLCSLFSIIGIWSAYLLGWHVTGYLSTAFGGFSLLLGLVLLAIVIFHITGHQHSVLTGYDLFALTLISYFGGILTAWLSVGVGELIGIYLILRRFDVSMAVAASVIISAITVWSALPHHLSENSQVNWNIVMFAGPGAVIGGIFARTLVTWLSARKLKLLFAYWAA